MKLNKKLFMLFVIVISNLLHGALYGESKIDINTGYTKNEILYMPWGDGENEVGLKEEEIEYNDGASIRKDVTRITPAKIKIDGKSKVYFEDVVNWKVVKYDPQDAAIEKHESNEGYLKVLVDKEDEGLYIFNSSNNSVDIILPDKDRYRKRNLIISEYLVNTKMKIKNKVLYSGKRKKISFDETDTSNIDPLDVETIYEYDFNAKKAYVKLYITKPLYTYKFINLKKIGAICDEIKHKIDFQSEYNAFINVDKDRNIYYLFHRSPNDQDDPIEYFIVKMDPILCTINIIFLEIDEFSGYMVSPEENVDVDINGNIYQLINKDDGVHVFLWSK